MSFNDFPHFFRKRRLTYFFLISPKETKRDQVINVTFILFSVKCVETGWYRLVTKEGSERPLADMTRIKV